MDFSRKVLDKIDELLTTEPARMIGYGAAVVIFLVLQVLNARGITVLGPTMTFEETVGLAFGSIAILVGIVESVRRFVYSPQTYAQDLLKSYAEGHIDAHEEEARAAEADLRDVPKTFTATIGNAQPAGTKKVLS